MLLARAKAWLKPSGDPDARMTASIQKRQKLIKRVQRAVPHFRTALVVAGSIYLVALPSELLARGSYVDENALQPAQVNTYWNWADVHIADGYANDVETWSRPNWDSNRRAEAIRDAFQQLGLSAATQGYQHNLSSSSKTLIGTNAYGILQAPKTDGAESLVLGASWLSRSRDEQGNRRINTRGVATVLAVANYLKKYSMWSKDIIFLISDDYADGVHAWLDAYHGSEQSNFEAQRLPISSGPIWAALNIDYPHHSFSHAGLFFEGANGHLPNLDIINTATHILKHTGITPILHSDPYLASLSPTPLSATPLYFLDGPVLQTYYRAAKNLVHQLAIGASGRVSGPEGVYGRYRIDAVTFFGVPAEGPHGFHDMGRAIESTFRSLNNLLERLHHSSSLYLLSSVDTFISAQNYLAAPILISAGMTFTGFLLWGEKSAKSLAAEKRLRNSGVEVRPKSIGKAAAAVGITHLVGAAMGALVARVDPTVEIPALLIGTLAFILAFTPLLLSLALSPSPSASLTAHASISSTLKSLTLLLSGMIIAVTATLNFGLAVLLAILLGPSLLLSSSRSTNSAPPSDLKTRMEQGILFTMNPLGLWVVWNFVSTGADEWAREMVRDWMVFGTWTMPFVFGAVVPLGMQAATAALL
ncbi:GPI-anchor transamidase subunit GAA1, partial [Phenoliferia sp. Uapishka_3]